MDHHNVVGDRLSDFIVKLNTHEEILSYCAQGIFRPREEPIDTSVTDKTGEITATHSQGISSWGHCEHDVNVFTRTSHEVRPSKFLLLRQALLSHFIFKGLSKTVLFLFREESWHHSNSEDVVD